MFPYSGFEVPEGAENSGEEDPGEKPGEKSDDLRVVTTSTKGSHRRSNKHQGSDEPCYRSHHAEAVLFGESDDVQDR